MGSLSHDATTVGPAVSTASNPLRKPRSGASNHLEDDSSQGELDDVSDNEEPHAGHMSDEEEAGELVGFSIGEAQKHMKSAQTPAAEKAKALDTHAEDYFDIGALDDRDGEAEGLSESPPALDVHQDVTLQQLQQSAPARHADAAATRPQQGGSLPSPWNPSQALQQRSTTTRAMLSQGFTNLRRRASSGPSAVADSVRKMLPEIPSLSFPKDQTFPTLTYVKPKEEPAPALSPRQSRLQTLSATPSQFDGSSQAQQPAVKRTPTHRDTSASSTARSTHSHRLLRRSTSDHSLYLRRGLSGVDSLDDTSKWSDVSEQVNSRFKAITDSLADSAFRMPKLPSLSFTNLRPLGTERPQSVSARGGHPSIDRPHGNRANVAIANAQGLDGTVVGEKRAHPLLAHALSGLTGDVIVLGGYRGSILRSAKPPHRQCWVPVKVGLNIRKVDMEVGLNPEDEERMEETIIPSGTLSHIGPVDICRRLLRHLNKCGNARSGKLRVHDYGYDWRLSPHLSSRRLIDFVEKLKCNQPGTPVKSRGVTMIAHSLGGLITRHTVNRRPELFAGVVYAGTPQRCVNILGPLRNGDAVLLSSRVLTAQVNFSMRTSFALLPEDGKCFFNKQTGERYDVDFFDVNTWDEYRLSPCMRPPLPPDRQEHRKSIIEVLSDNIPSLPNHSRRTSKIFGKDFEPERGRESQFDHAKHALADTAGRAAEATNPETSPPGFEPSMGQSYDRQSISTACTIPKDQATAYLKRTLSEIKAFKHELAFRPEHEAANVYPPVSFMFCKGVPTVYGARVASREAIKRSDAYDDLAFAAGDGVVLASASMLPRGYRCVKGGKVESDRGHVGLLGDLEGVGKALQAVVDARKKGIGLGREFGGRSSDGPLAEKSRSP